MTKCVEYQLYIKQNHRSIDSPSLTVVGDQSAELVSDKSVRVTKEKEDHVSQLAHRHRISYGC